MAELRLAQLTFNLWEGWEKLWDGSEGTYL